MPGSSPIWSPSDTGEAEFARSAIAVNGSLRHAEGLVRALGVGEAPIGRLGTFGIWESMDAARRWASNDAAHNEATARARSEAWFAEELFVRFEPSSSSGTWNGLDPLGDDQSR